MTTTRKPRELSDGAKQFLFASVRMPREDKLFITLLAQSLDAPRPVGSSELLNIYEHRVRHREAYPEIAAKAYVLAQGPTDQDQGECL